MSTRTWSNALFSVFTKGEEGEDVNVTVSSTNGGTTPDPRWVKVEKSVREEIKAYLQDETFWLQPDPLHTMIIIWGRSAIEGNLGDDWVGDQSVTANLSEGFQHIAHFKKHG